MKGKIVVLRILTRIEKPEKPKLKTIFFLPDPDLSISSRYVYNKF